MKKTKICFALVLLILVNLHLPAQTNDSLIREAEITMLNATKYMVEKVSLNGGYVWYYLPDFSRQWGEMEAYKTMTWLQSPGTVRLQFKTPVLQPK